MKTFGSVKSIAVKIPLSINAVGFSKHVLSGFKSPKENMLELRGFYVFLGHELKNCQRTLAQLKGMRVRQTLQTLVRVNFECLPREMQLIRVSALFTTER